MPKKYETLLKRKYGTDEVITFPKTLAKLVFLTKPDAITGANDLDSIIEGIADRLIALEEQAENANHFKGAFDSIYSLNQWYKNNNVSPVSGDYAIIKRKIENDFFVVWDEDAKEWKNQGTIVESLVKSVQGLTGHVVLNGNNIESTYDSSGNSKLISEILKSLNDYTIEHEDEINELYEKVTKINETLETINTDINTVDENHLEYKGVWVSGNTYNKNDIVTYGKHLYICLKNKVTSEPTSGIETGDWAIFVEGFSGKYEDLEGKPTNLITQEQLKEAIGAIPTPDVSGQIAAHNEDKTAHPDIRQELEEIRSLLPTITILE